MNKRDARNLSPLVLAYVGDAVYELFIRTVMIREYKKVNDLHENTVKFVKASSQAEILRKLKKQLTSEERDIARNARNTKVNSVPKNADIADYHYSTGFEALLGYLYLTGQSERLNEILIAAYQLGITLNE